MLKVKNKYPPYMWKSDSRPVALNVIADVLPIAAEDGSAPARQCLTAWSISIYVSRLNEKKTIFR